MSDQVYEIARRKAKQYKLDEGIFLRLVGAESDGNATAVSPAGARGAGQLMPATARALGVKDVNDPEQNLDGAARYLRQQLKAFGGSYRLALAAYNAGPGAVKKYGGVPPYRETQAYVQKILGSGDKKATPPKAKLEDPEPSTNSQTITIPGAPQKRSGGVLELLEGKIDATEFAQMRRAQPGPDQTVTIPGGASPPSSGRKSVADDFREVELKGSGGYMGTYGVAKQLASIGFNLGLKPTSEKRNNSNPYSGSRSDHDYGNKDAYAFDISNGSQPTPEMDRAAYRIARQLGIKDYAMGQPIMKTVQKGKFRVQVIYRGDGPSFGGNHMSHIHLGVKRVG